jgi:hypothetical protein
MSTAAKQMDFNNLIYRENTLRWPNLDAHGVSLKIAVYGDGSQHVFAEGNLTEVAKLSQLGFTEIGGEFALENVKIEPRKLKHVFPEIVMDRHMRTSQIYVDRTEFETQHDRDDAINNETFNPKR